MEKKNPIEKDPYDRIDPEFLEMLRSEAFTALLGEGYDRLKKELDLYENRIGEYKKDDGYFLGELFPDEENAHIFNEGNMGALIDAYEDIAKGMDKDEDPFALRSLWYDISRLQKPETAAKPKPDRYVLDEKELDGIMDAVIVPLAYLHKNKDSMDVLEYVDKLSEFQEGVKRYEDYVNKKAKGRGMYEQLAMFEQIRDAYGRAMRKADPEGEFSEGAVAQLDKEVNKAYRALGIDGLRRELPLARKNRNGSKGAADSEQMKKSNGRRLGTYESFALGQQKLYDEFVKDQQGLYDTFANSSQAAHDSFVNGT